MLPPLRWWLALFLAAVMVVLLWFVGHVGWMLVVGFQEELNNENLSAHVAVVMGNQVLGPAKPGPRLKARLDQAYELYNNRRVQRILVSGGLGQEGYEEAVEMGRYLVRRGIPKEMIFVDALGDDTFQTARNTQRMLEARPNLRSLVVVTSYHHILRSKLALQRCGFPVVYGSYARHFEWRDLWFSIPKEVLAYYQYLVRDCPPAITY